MPRLLIYGDGGFGRELLLTLRGVERPGPVAFVDDASAARDHAGVPVIQFEETSSNDYFVLAVGSSRVREELDARCRAKDMIPWTLVGRSAELGHELEIGEGALLCSKTVLTGFSRIGRQFQCNIYSYVAHDCVIGDYVTFAPHVHCNGNVRIDNHAYIGTGAILRQGTPEKPLHIGEGSIVGMGAVVTRDVAPYTTVVGNPARPLVRRS